ncbi:MAG: uroporphyrinogen-III C-methyltransferase, partial [Aquabacterium sp.]|nr:uroporphyrinogen-III C-methyltransferase [Aquabacterium sp.]
DQQHSEHTLHTLGEASAIHAGRPTVVVVGVGASAVTPPCAASPSATSSPPDARPCGDAPPTTPPAV